MLRRAHIDGIRVRHPDGARSSRSHRSEEAAYVTGGYAKRPHSFRDVGEYYVN